MTAKNPNRGGINRRKLLALGASAVGSAAAGTAIAEGLSSHDGMLDGPVQSITGTLPWQEGQADAPDPATAGGLQYLTPAEAEFITAAVDRLIPPDTTGPSGSEAGVPTFIDRQLAGPFGQGQHFYLAGPWPEGTESQGYQSRLTPAELYRKAIAEIEDAIGKANGGKHFKDMDPDDQDKLLKAMESGDLKLDGPVKAKSFFTMFLQNVKEGYFSDPLYGGNKNGGAWAMIGFPGAHYNYAPWVTRYNEPVPLAPVGLRGRSGWNRG